MTRKLTMPAAMVLALGFMTGPAHGQQYGPPASGNTSALQFVPATLNLVAGLNSAGYGGDGGPANSATTQFNYPIGIAYDTNGNLFIADGQNEIVRRIDHTTGYISTFAGTPQTFGTSTTYTGPASTATFGYLSGLVIDSSNNVYVADRSNNVVWKITAAGAVSPYAGGGTTPSTCTGSTDSIGDGCQALQATISNVWGLGIDASNNIYIADSYDDLVREVNATTGVITVFAGDPADASIGYGACSSQGLWVTGTSAPYTASEMHMCFPAAVAFDSNGDAFIADEKGYVIREVTKGGVASIFAGNGAGTCTNAVDSIGDGCPATDAKLDHPSAIYVDASSRVYLADGGGSYVRMVDSTGNITMAMGTTLGELSKGSIGEPDTEPLPYGYGYTGAGDGIDGITMDPLGNIVASDSSGAAVTSAGSTGQYVFPETEILTTSTTTSAHATSQYYPPYILISNPSGVTLTLTGTPTVTGPFAVVTGVGAGTCTFPGSVAAGQTCTIVLSFTPTAGGSPGTAFNGTVSFDTNASAAPAVINLVGDGIGTATTSATLTVPGNTNLLTFTSPANVQSATQLVTLKNTGQTAIAISSYDFNGYSPTDFSVTGTTCPVAGGSGTLSAGDTCTYSIAFTPTSATTFEAGFQVCISTASYGCIQSVNLQGTGTGVVTLTPSPLAFNPEQVGNTSGPMVATLTNGNEPALTGTTITIVGANPTDFAIVNGANSCGTTVDGDGGTCSIYVTFSPASPTSFMATLQVAGMASGAPVTVSVPLTGSGLASTFGDTLSLSSLNFYGQIVGTTSGTITEQISNPAVGQSGAINFSAITATAPFAIGTGANACSTTAALEPDTVCNVYVTFTPGAAQAYTGNLTLTSNAVGSPQMVPLSGQGVIFNEPENQTQAMQTMNVYFSAYGETVDIYLLTQGGTYEEFYPDSTAG
ncbi:MAG: choice-of-anchor D domain-containing protein [Acidobacteriaceae bacterium]